MGRSRSAAYLLLYREFVLIHAFEFQGLYIVLDVESGAVHAVDEPAFDVLSAVEQGRDPFQTGVDAALVREILDELDALREEGVLDTAAQPVPQAKDAQVIKAMCLHIAHDCNLRCRYCFASTGEFHGTRMLMPPEIGKAALDFLIARSGNRKNLEVDLFGGEPLMNMDAVYKIVAYGRELEKKHGKTIRFTMTTNGLALNDEIIEFINREMYNVVLSVDGRREVHDLMRPTAGGKGSYDVILPKMKKLVQRRGDGEYYVRGTFTSRNLDFTKDVEALLAEGFEQISLEPVVLDSSDPLAITQEHLPKVHEEYDKLAAHLLENRANGKWYNFFHFMMDLGNGPCLRKRVTGCGAGNEYVAVTPEGDIYPCHQFVGEKGFCMGNILDGTFDSTMQERFQNCNVCTKTACGQCWAKYFCSGGCAANAWKYNGDIYAPYALTCDLEKKRTECAIGINLKERGL